MGHVREFQAGDAAALAPHLRMADLQEIQAASGQPPITALLVGAEQSAPSCTVIGNSGKVAGMFGVVPEGDFGRVWMLGSDELVAPPLSRQFIRECRQFLAFMERPYLAIGNVIDARNVVHIRWLKWMGFTFINCIPEYGIERRPFLEFIKLCANQCQ